MPVKLSDELLNVAPKEAAAADRSITAQIEHWAKLGQSLEAALRHEDALAVKASQGKLAVAFPVPATRDAVYEFLQTVASADHARLGQTLRRGRTVYESDPSGSGAIIRVAPNGRRTRGRLEKRAFVRTVAARRRAR
jgi:ParD-like antitoxin of type II bacterial toxin-antitoxin system